MRRLTFFRLWPFAFGLCVASGCAGYDLRSTPAAPPPLSASNPPAIKQASYVAAHNAATVQRVQEVGRKLAVANPQLGFKPAFQVTGDAGPRIAHRGEQEIVISEGLVRQCQSEGQLAGVLSWELARMAGERQARIAQLTAASSREPPPEVRIGPDGGTFGEADQIRKAELAKLGMDRRRPKDKDTPPPAPDPQLLARQFLTQAGYAEADLDAALPLIQP